MYVMYLCYQRASIKEVMSLQESSSETMKQKASRQFFSSVLSFIKSFNTAGLLEDHVVSQTIKT